MASTRHLVDPELLQFLDEMPTRRLSAEALPQLRADAAALLAEQQALEPEFPGC